MKSDFLVRLCSCCDLVLQSMQALASQETGLVNCYSHYIQLESSIIQRLKWAAGANPSLNLVLQQFDDASTLRKLLYEVRTVLHYHTVMLKKNIFIQV